MDTAVLEARLKKVLEDRPHFEQLKQARARERSCWKDCRAGERKPEEWGVKAKISKPEKEFQMASRGLTAVDWFDKSVALWGDGKFTDPGKAIEYLSEAIRLKPDYVVAYYNRGLLMTTWGSTSGPFRIPIRPSA